MFSKLITTLFTVIALSAGATHAQAAVDVNRATQAELESIKGIGPGLSAKIMQARQTGEFKNWNDLVDRVGGVGPGNASRFSQAGLTVAGAGYESGAAKPTKAVKTEKAAR
jgi:competence protein ComEA